VQDQVFCYRKAIYLILPYYLKNSKIHQIDL